MERRIEEYLNLKDTIVEPYENHYGHGCTMGFYDVTGRGRAYVSYNADDKCGNKGLISFNGNKLYIVDNYLLYITNIHEPWANGEIIKNDLTTQSCYIGKVNDKYVVSNTLHDGLDKLREVISVTENNEKDTAKAFVIAHPCYEEEYDWEEMVSWHKLIKQSCDDGRKNFSLYSNKENFKKTTPKKLIELMKNYGVTRLATYMEEYYLEKESQ